MISEFQIRKKLFDYMDRHNEILIRFLSTWNEKLGHGIPMAPELLVDLFGCDLFTSMEDEMIHSKEGNNAYVILSVGPWMNEENPFQVVFVYKVEIHTSTEDIVEYFHMGYEQELIKFCYERGLN